MPGLPRGIRFVLSLLPALAVLVAALAAVGFVASRVDGGLGLALGILSGASLAFGVTLAYWVMVDWLNLRVIRRGLAVGSTLRDGAVVAFDGVVRVDGEPMRAPFSGTPAAAYTYVVAATHHAPTGSGTRRYVMTQGFHLQPTRIEGPSRSLRLRTFPSFEDELRGNEQGGAWGRQAKVLDGVLDGRAPSGSQRERESRLIEARHTVLDEIHTDYRVSAIGDRTDGLTIDEEVLPADTRVCVIATYEQASGSLTGRRARIGPNVMVYIGSREEVLARVSADTRWFLRAIAVLLVLAVLPILLALAA